MGRVLEFKLYFHIGLIYREPTSTINLYMFPIASLIKKGNNSLRIEVATTLERENARKSKLKTAKPTGITGEVNLYIK